MGQKPQFPAACQQSLGNLAQSFPYPTSITTTTRCQLFCRGFPHPFRWHQVQNHTTINRLSAGRVACLLISNSIHSKQILFFYTHYRHNSGRWGTILIPTVRRKHHKALSMAHTMEIYESSCPCPVMDKKMFQIATRLSEDFSLFFLRIC